MTTRAPADGLSTIESDRRAGSVFDVRRRGDGCVQRCSPWPRARSRSSSVLPSAFPVIRHISRSGPSSGWSRSRARSRRRASCSSWPMFLLVAYVADAAPGVAGRVAVSGAIGALLAATLLRGASGPHVHQHSGRRRVDPPVRRRVRDRDGRRRGSLGRDQAVLRSRRLCRAGDPVGRVDEHRAVGAQVRVGRRVSARPAGDPGRLPTGLTLVRHRLRWHSTCRIRRRVDAAAVGRSVPTTSVRCSRPAACWPRTSPWRRGRGRSAPLRWSSSESARLPSSTRSRVARWLRWSRPHCSPRPSAMCAPC